MSLGPYQDIAKNLNRLDLCRLDAACRQLRLANEPLWQGLGIAQFLGLELKVGEKEFAGFQDSKCHTCIQCGLSNWKGCFREFSNKAVKFRNEDCAEITSLSA